MSKTKENEIVSFDILNEWDTETVTATTTDTTTIDVPVIVEPTVVVETKKDTKKATKKATKKVPEAKAEEVIVETPVETVPELPVDTTSTDKPVKVTEFVADILAIFTAADRPLRVSEVKAAYNTGKGTDLGIKKFTDTLWTVSDKNSRRKNPVLKGTDKTGVYTLV